MGPAGVGTASCPWYIAAARGQKLNLTLYNFISPTLATSANSASFLHSTRSIPTDNPVARCASFSQGRGQNIMFGGLEPRAWRAREGEPMTGVWGRNRVRRSGASPPEAKSSLAFESLAAEQNVPDSVYVAVHTGVNYKTFCNQKFK